MARIEVVMPQMGESIAEGTIMKWHKKIGDAVRKDETLLEISTDKVDSEIPSPASGTLVEIVVKEQQTVPVQTVIAYLDTEPGGAAKTPAAMGGEPEPVAGEGKQESSRKGFYSPLVLTVARTENVTMEELERISGSGEGGRVTKKDILAFVEERKAGRLVPAPSSPTTSPAPTLVPPVAAGDLRKRYPSPAHDLVPMSNVLQKMAQHMVNSVHTSPHVAAVHEVDMTAIVRHRDAHAEEFERTEGFKLTYTPYIVDAVVRAIKKYPMVNCSVEGTTIVKKNFINVGLAVASESGLLVPVIKRAEEKNFLGIARVINDLAGRTRAKKLTPEDIQGGTFTISNYGVFGTLIGTPIINQPQVAILGTGAIRKRVVVVDDAIAIRSIAFFTLSFDHRVVDGALGGMFLEQIVQNLQTVDVTVKF